MHVAEYFSLKSTRDSRVMLNGCFVFYRFGERFVSVLLRAGTLVACLFATTTTVLLEGRERERREPILRNKLSLFDFELVPRLGLLERMLSAGAHIRNTNADSHEQQARTKDDSSTVVRASKFVGEVKELFALLPLVFVGETKRI